MEANDIAHKYVHGHHDALTDSQEKKDMEADIIAFALQMCKEQRKICGGECLVGRTTQPIVMRNAPAPKGLS